MARTFDGTVEAYVAPIAKTVKVRNHSAGTAYTAENITELYGVMLSAAEKHKVTVSVFCPDIEKGRKGGFTVAELKALDTDKYQPKLLGGRFGAYVAVLADDDKSVSTGAKTIVL